MKTIQFQSFEPYTADQVDAAAVYLATLTLNESVPGNRKLPLAEYFEYQRGWPDGFIKMVTERIRQSAESADYFWVKPAIEIVSKLNDVKHFALTPKQYLQIKLSEAIDADKPELKRTLRVMLDNLNIAIDTIQLAGKPVTNDIVQEMVKNIEYVINLNTNSPFSADLRRQRAIWMDYIKDQAHV